MSNNSNWSNSTRIAIEYLQRIKPNDGWSIEVKQSTSLVRLLRRNIPVTDTYFLDIHYDEIGSRNVVGILTPPRPDSSTVQGQVLVDPAGKLTNTNSNQRLSIIPISGYSRSTTTTATRSGPTSSSDNSTTGGGNFGSGFGTGTGFSDEEKRQMMMYFGYAVAGALFLRVFLTAFIGLYVLALPILFVYMIQVCPPKSSFDVKKELKRVLRGQHLPENHPRKPQGFLSETIARVTASVATELATLPGYEVTTTDFAGAATLICVRVPTANFDFYWIGAFNQWYFLRSNEIETTNNNNTNRNNNPYNPNTSSFRR